MRLIMMMIVIVINCHGFQHPLEQSACLLVCCGSTKQIKHALRQRMRRWRWRSIIYPIKASSVLPSMLLRQRETAIKLIKHRLCLGWWLCLLLCIARIQSHRQCTEEVEFILLKKRPSQLTQLDETISGNYTLCMTL